MKTLVLSCLLLCGCAATRPAPIPDPGPPAPVQCPASASAPAEDPPVDPLAADEAKRDTLYAGVVGALGPALAESYLRWSEAEFPGWARRQVERVRATQAWCAAVAVGGA